MDNGTFSNGKIPTATNSNVLNDGSNPISIFNATDYKNFLLAGSQGGTAGTDQGIFSKFANQDSRFAHANNDQFQAAIAGMYANQFKGYALGLDVAFEPGKDINALSNNLVKAGTTRMTPEAEMLSKVAALYRGNLTGVNLYNNGALKNLLTQWGRSDIANKPFTGSQSGDVQSIGGVVQALNEQPDAAVRQKWLQQVFDFAGNTPNSPSGAVPNLPQYQQAINLVRQNTFDTLLNGFLANPGN